MQLLTTLEIWTQAVEDGTPVDAIYLDFQKAFNSVPHKRLLRKLAAYAMESQGKSYGGLKPSLRTESKEQHSRMTPITSHTGLPKVANKL